VAVSSHYDEYDADDYNDNDGTGADGRNKKKYGGESVFRWTTILHHCC
jgi:hypothetical protein